MMGKSRHILFEVLEPRILLSADGLLNVILLDHEQDLSLDGMPDGIQYAGLLDTNEQVEEQISLELAPPDTPNTNVCQPILTLVVDDNKTIDESIDVDLTVDNISPAQVNSEIAVILNDFDEDIESEVSATENDSPPICVNDAEIIIEENTSIEIRGPPSGETGLDNTISSCLQSERLEVDPTILNEYAAEVQPNGTVDLPGMYLVDPTTNYDGQIVYLDFDGEENVTYNGPVIVEGIDIPEFSANASGLGGQESAIISQILFALEQQFEGTGVLSTTTEPDSDNSYSTVFIGGDDSAFVEYGSFLGLAEKVDVSNQGRMDNAFVFSESIPSGKQNADHYAVTLAQLIAHETGHLLGYTHDFVSSNYILSHVAQEVYFADPNLKAAVEAELGVSDPTAVDMLALTWLNASSRGITDLTGFEYGDNLETLYLGYNQISDISPISGLTNLWYLTIDNNQISDIGPISGLTNFTYLDLRTNPLNGDAYSIYIPQIIANNPGMTLLYDPPIQPTVNWDIDGNGTANALTDGILAVRYMFGATGSVLTDGAVATDATRTNALDIESYIVSYMLSPLASAYFVGANFISPDWFETVAANSQRASEQGVAIQGTHVEGDTVAIDWSGKSVEVVPNEWIVQFTSSSVGNISVSESVSLLPDDGFGFEVVSGLGMTGQILIRTDDVETSVVKDWLGANPNVAYFEPNALYMLDVTPNDPLFSDEWGLHNTGQTGGTPGTDIDALQAWDVTTGSRDIVVAVIDSGIDYTHPDLADNIWTNPGEIPGNGIDDDGNGFVDDVHGWDFYANDGDPLDELFHGTHVAGTLGAAGNNGVGVSGINWTSSVMALKIGGPDRYLSRAAAIGALNYATMMRTDYGINVVLTNNSWGGGGYSQALYDAIAASGQAGMLFVAAAGNSGADNDSSPHYPSGYDLDNIIAVAATDHRDRLASFSNYGADSVDLAAPGVSILSTFPTDMTDGMREDNFSTDYESIGGTSMAAPHVAGVAALLWASAPNASYDQIRNTILDSVDQVSALSAKVATGGRLNAAQAMDLLGFYVTTSAPASGEVVNMPITQVQVDFSDAFDQTSIDASDLSLNGTAADSYQILDTDSILFAFNTSPTVNQGLQTTSISPGAIQRESDNHPLRAWSDTFFFDSGSIQIVATTPAAGQTLSAPPTSISIQMNEIIDPDTIVRDALTLNEGVVTGVALDSSDTVRYSVSGLPYEGDVSFNLSSGAVRDIYGSPSPDYTGHFIIDDPTIHRYASADVPRAIRDKETVYSQITVMDSFQVVDIDVALDISHTFDADLDVYLVSPAGTRVRLFADVGGSGNDFISTILDDEASKSITAGQAPFTGRYRPDSALSALDEENSSGTWKLSIYDDAQVDNGTLNDWSIILTEAQDTGPRIIDQYPRVRTAGPVDSVRVVFDESIATGSFQLDDVVHMEGPAGVISPTDVVAVSGSNDTEFDILFPSQSTGGDYVLVIGPHISDMAGNEMDQDGDSVFGEPGSDPWQAESDDDQYELRFMLDLPDFSWNYILGPTGVISGRTMSINRSYEIATAQVSPDFMIRYALSVNTIWGDSDDVVLVPDETISTVYGKTIGSHTESFVVTVSNNTTPGVYRILAKIDADDSIPESDPDNNVVVSDTLIVAGPGIVGHDPQIATESANSLQFSFSHPMDIATFGVAHDITSFAGPEGIDLLSDITGHEWIDNQNLKISFLQQVTLGSYEMVIGPHITDLFGRDLDQNHDGHCGTPEDTYTAQFTLNELAPDDTGPRVVGIEPGVTEGPISSITFTFGEHIDANSFTIADLVSFTGPSGSLADQITDISGVNDRWTVTFTAQGAQGEYTMVIGPHIDDPSGNPMDQDEDGINGESTEDRYTALVTIRDIQNYYVNDSSRTGDIYTTAVGENSNNGLTPGAPKADLSAILSAYDLGPGDIVYLDSGHYPLRSDNSIDIPVADSGSASGYVTVRGVPGRTIIDGYGVWIDADYIRIEGLTITGTTRGIAAWSVTAGNLIITDNVLSDCGWGIDFRYFQEGFGEIVNNLFLENDRAVSFTTGSWKGQMLIRNNTIVYTGLNNNLTDPNYGIELSVRENTPIIVNNNIISMSGNDAYALSVNSEFLDSSVAHSDYNNLRVMNGAYVGFSEPAPFTNDPDLLYPTLADWQIDAGLDLHSISVDPLFADPADGDYHLKSEAGRYDPTGGTWVVDAQTSWCIDSGDPAYPIGDEVPDGNRQINIGMYGGTGQASKTPPSRRLLVTTPNAGESLAGLARLRWIYQGYEWQNGDALRVEYSSNAGWDWVPIMGGENVKVTDEQFEWNTLQAVPNYGTHFLLRISAHSEDTHFSVSETISDTSDKVFALHNQPLAYYINDTGTAGDVYTSAPGSDGNDGGSPVSPMASLQALLLLRDLEPGDVVYMDTGHYLVENDIEISIEDSGDASGFVTVRGSPCGTVVDRQGAGSALVVEADYLRIEGLTIIGASNRGIAVEHVMNYGIIDIVNNVISGAGIGIHYSNTSDATFNTSCRITNNLFVENSTGIYASDWNGHTQLVIRNNTIVGTGPSSLGMEFSVHWLSEIVLANNVISISGENAYALAVDQDFLSDADVLSDYNNFHVAGGAYLGIWDNFSNDRLYASLADWQNATGFDLHSISVDPLFADPANNDYHPQPGSPCIDAGDNSAVPVGITTDLDGKPRFSDDPLTPDTGSGTPPIVDMGAYELYDDTIAPVVQAWSLSEDTGADSTDKLTNDTTPQLTFTFSEVIFGEDSDVIILDSNSSSVTPDSITGWDSDTVVIAFTTALVLEGEFTVTLNGTDTIEDGAGNELNDGADEVVSFYLDTTAPAVTVDTLLTNDPTPELTGTVDDPDATIEVTVSGNSYSAVNNGDGTWTLVDDTITSPLADGTYDVAVTATDMAGNVGTDTTTNELTVDTTLAVYHPADTNSNYIIGDFELLDYIDLWAQGQVGDFELLDTIDLWAAGHYYWDPVEERFKPGEESSTLNEYAAEMQLDASVVLPALSYSSYDVTTGSTNLANWISGEQGPTWWTISPVNPTTGDVIYFSGPTGVYSNDSFAEGAAGGSPVITVDVLNHRIELWFQPPAPELSYQQWAPVCGIEGDFGRLEAGEWLFFGTDLFASFHIPFTITVQPTLILSIDDVSMFEGD